MKILITEFMDEDAVQLLEQNAELDVTYNPQLVDNSALLRHEIVDADLIIIRNRTQIRGDLLEKAKQLQWVGRLGVGLDNIDLDACKKHNIKVQPATGANAQSVAEYVLAATMIMCRTPAYDVTEQLLKGHWPREMASKGAEIGGKTLGLIGYGTIAHAVAHRAKAFHMNIIAHDPMIKDADIPLLPFDTVIREADVISLHIPLNDQTRNLIDHKALSVMKPSALVINTARGGIIDEAALCDALSSKSIHGAALDVFETEPLTAETAAKFEGLENLILTPHIAGVTTDANQRVSTMIAKAALDFTKQSNS